MTYLFDTNVVSGMMRGDKPIVAWLSSIASNDRLVICTVVLGEISFGLQRLPLGRRRTELETKAADLLRVLPCEPITSDVALSYAALKVSQQRLGSPLDENDLWIAATATSLGATLVTRDSDFRLIASLAPVIL